VSLIPYAYFISEAIGRLSMKLCIRWLPCGKFKFACHRCNSTN